MKTAAKVFIIIGMVVGFWWICPIIFGIIALNKLNKVKEKSELTATSILTLIFCSALGGIFMLCIPESDFPGKEAPAPTFNPYQQQGQSMQYQPTAIPQAPQQPQFVPQAQPQYTPQPQYVPPVQPQAQPQYVPPVQPQQNAPQQAQAPYYPPQNNG